MGIAPLHVISSNDRRGAETAAVELAGQLDRRSPGSRVVALAPGRQGGLDVPVLAGRRFTPAGLVSLRKLAEQSPLVVAHGSSTLPAVAAATVGTGVPFVYRSIGDPRAWVTSRRRQFRVGAAARRAAAVVALWDASAVAWHELLGVAAERVVVIPNAVGADDFSPASPAERSAARTAFGLQPEAPVALYLGALSPEKRVEAAVAAVASIDGAQLLVVGDGPERRRLESMAASVAGGRVRLAGATDRPQQALAAADVVVIPSATEGQPAVAIEAGLCGLPVVASAVGGLPSVVDDGKTGMLVPPGDDGRLAQAVVAALGAREEMGAAGRRYCTEHFCLDAVASRWEALLAQVAAGRALRPQG